MNVVGAEHFLAVGPEPPPTPRQNFLDLSMLSIIETLYVYLLYCNILRTLKTHHPD